MARSNLTTTFERDVLSTPLVRRAIFLFFLTTKPCARIPQTYTRYYEYLDSKTESRKTAEKRARARKRVAAVPPRARDGYKRVANSAARTPVAMSVPGSMRPDTTLSKDAKTDDVRLWLGETSVGKKRPSASAVDAAVGSLQKVSISFQGGDGTGKTGAASRRGSLDRSAGAHHPNGDDVDKEDNTDVTDDEDEAGLCTDQRELARLALYWILGKTDLILGVVLLGVAMWVRAKMLLSDDPRKKKTVGDEENAWRWMLFVACILLGASDEPIGTFRRRLSQASAPTFFQAPETVNPFRLTAPSPSTRRPRPIPRALARQHHHIRARQARERRVDGRNRRVTGVDRPATPTGTPQGARRSGDGAEIRGVLPARPEGAAQAAAADDRHHGVVGDAREVGAGGERRRA